MRESGMSSLFRRIEIVSEKDVPTYRRLLEEFAVAPAEFAMVGNSLRSDIAPVLELGGWGLHLPYHLTWEHEREATLPAEDRVRMATLGSAAELPAALQSILAA